MCLVLGTVLNYIIYYDFFFFYSVSQNKEYHCEVWDTIESQNIEPPLL